MNWDLGDGILPRYSSQTLSGVMIPYKGVDFMDDLQKELRENEKQLALLRERIKVAGEDYELFIEKLKEVERWPSTIQWWSCGP